MEKLEKILRVAKCICCVIGAICTGIVAAIRATRYIKEPTVMEFDDEEI